MCAIRCTEGTMFTPIRISGAILVSAAIAFAVTAPPAAIGHESPPSSQQQPVQRRSTLTGVDCSQRNWPNTRCQLDVNRDAGSGRIVRMIALR